MCDLWSWSVESVYQWYDHILSDVVAIYLLAHHREYIGWDIVVTRYIVLPFSIDDDVFEFWFTE
jgi:hypothetical protein